MEKEKDINAYWEALENKRLLRLIDAIINYTTREQIDALYEVVVEGDYDYVENLFPTKKDFKEFIEKYKND